MNCIDPPALTDLDLARYLDGEADAAVVQHIAACPLCRANALAQAQAQQAVAGLLYRSTCPSPEELRDYHGALLNRADSSNIALHVARCPHCTRELFVLNQFVSTEAITSTSPLQQLTLHVATLLTDLLPITGNLLPLGQRGNDMPPRLYQAGEFQIGVEIIDDPTTGQKILQGMITGDDLDNLLVHLWHNGQLVATTTVDPLLGDFRFFNLPPFAGDSDNAGLYELIVSAPQVKVRVPSLRLDA